MSYYPTIDEDLKRAKEILERGKAEPPDLPIAEHIHFGGTIYGADTYAAYKLLESFVAEIARLRAQAKTDEQTITHNLTSIERLCEEVEWSRAKGREEIARLRALVDAVGEDVCTTALRARQHGDQPRDK